MAGQVLGSTWSKKYPDLERGESASQTGRDHIPPRLFKEAVHLHRMKDQIMAILNDTNPFNKKDKLDELKALLDKYYPRRGGSADEAQEARRSL